MLVPDSSGRTCGRQANLARRGFRLDACHGSLEERRKVPDAGRAAATTATCVRRNRQGQGGGQDTAPLPAAVQELGDELDKADAKLRTIRKSTTSSSASPTSSTTPCRTARRDHNRNQPLEPPEFAFRHVIMTTRGRAAGPLLPERSRRRLAVLHGRSRLHRASSTHARRSRRQHSYRVYVPYRVNRHAGRHGNLPKFERISSA